LLHQVGTPRHFHIQRKVNINKEKRLSFTRIFVFYFPTFPESQTKQELVHFKKLSVSQTMQDVILISDSVRRDVPLSAPHTTSKYLKLRSCQQLGPCGFKQMVSGELETKRNEAVVFHSMYCSGICLKTLRRTTTSPWQLAFQQRFEQCTFPIRFWIMPQHQINGSDMRRDKIKQ